ncbi:MAG TPA: type II CAAX endopeptidase family protein [Thermoanaerobaculia bacterium]|nr:type II CAAX endopeptidase family protein [Thermoanaerobaculia bacterium]
MDSKLRALGPLGILAVLIILAAGLFVGPLAAALLVLLWRWLSKTPWRELGYVRPSVASVLIAIPAGALFKLLLKALVMPLLGADPVNRAYHFLAGNRAAIPGMLFTLIVVAGFGEETFFRGWMFERIGKLIGNIGALLVSTTLFAAAHYSVQGATGTEQAAITGLVFGAIYLRTRSLVPLMAAHAAFDLTAYALIYWNYETKVAGLLFKS